MESHKGLFNLEVQAVSSVHIQVSYVWKCIELQLDFIVICVDADSTVTLFSSDFGI